jgi:hypothetical protein
MSQRSTYMRATPFLLPRTADRGRLNEGIIATCAAIIRALEASGAVLPNRQYPIFPGERDNVKRTLREARFYLMDLLTWWNAEEYPFFTENGAASGSELTARDQEDYFETWYVGCRTGDIPTHLDPEFV